jgi:AraC-like DNA-binding protein
MRTMLQDVCRSPALRKLDALARELGGVGLLVVWSDNSGEHGQFALSGSENELPAFCRLLHAAPEGLRRCVSCHLLLAFAACNRGSVMEGRCHGGASVLMAPAIGPGVPPGAEVVVASSCAFAMDDGRRGWRLARERARDLGIDLRSLSHAYRTLPLIQGRKMRAVSGIVDAAAATLSEALHARTNDAESVPTPLIADKLRTALQLPREHTVRGSHASGGVTVVDIVQAVVGANPQLPVTVADIARTARLSPNHFSLLFRRQTGRTFSEFLAGKRLERAEELLMDLTLSVREVASQAGFPDANYFAKVFRGRTGLSPSRWRRTNLRRVCGRRRRIR